jgi:hypothetical protein
MNPHAAVTALAQAAYTSRANDPEEILKKASGMSGNKESIGTDCITAQRSSALRRPARRLPVLTSPSELVELSLVTPDSLPIRRSARRPMVDDVPRLAAS